MRFSTNREHINTTAFSLYGIYARSSSSSQMWEKFPTTPIQPIGPLPKETCHFLAFSPKHTLASILWALSTIALEHQNLQPVPLSSSTSAGPQIPNARAFSMSSAQTIHNPCRGSFWALCTISIGSSRWRSVAADFTRPPPKKFFLPLIEARNTL